MPILQTSSTRVPLLSYPNWWQKLALSARMVFINSIASKKENFQKNCYFVASVGQLHRKCSTPSSAPQPLPRVWDAHSVHAKHVVLIFVRVLEMVVSLGLLLCSMNEHVNPYDKHLFRLSTICEGPSYRDMSFMHPCFNLV